MVNIAKVARVISKATDSLEDARIIPKMPAVTPTAKPLFREAMPSEQRALMPDEGQRVAEFYSPTEEFLKDLPIPTKGIRGADILKAIEKEPTIRRQEVEAFGLDVDPQRRYTAEEVGQFVTRNPYRVEAQRPTAFDYTGSYTFQDTQRLELKPNEVQDISYDETIIRAIPAENKAGFVAAMGTHHTPDTIAHVRSSVKNIPSISDRDVYLIEEIQSDLVARGAKPTRGEITYSEALETGAKNTIDSLKERFKDLPSSAEIEINNEFLTDLYRFMVTRAVPERLKEFPTSFRVDPYKVMVEKYGVDNTDLAISYLEKRNVPRNTAIKLVQNIRNAAMEFAYADPIELTKAVGPAPIKDINEVARLGLQTAIADALSNGQTKLVIPNLEQIVAAGRARPGSTEWDKMTKPGSSFHRMYVTGMQKAIDQIKKDLPDISVATKVEFPFQPRAYYVPSVKDPIDLDNTVTILDLSAYEGKNLSRLRFADGGMAKRDKRGRPLVSPRPIKRPDFDAPRYTDPVLRGEDGRVITIVDETNPVTQLGQTMGDSFRVYEPRNLNARGIYLNPVSSDPNLEVLGGPDGSEMNTYYKEEYPNRNDLNINEIVIMGEGLDNSQTAAHEFMHRGFDLIRENFSEQKLEDRYGKSIAGIIHNPKYEHYLVQAVLENEGQQSFNDYNENLTDEGKEVIKSLVEPLYELAREASGERGFITDRDRGPRSRPNNKPPEKESFIGIIKKALGFADGGTVVNEVFAKGGLTMEEQMNLFQHGGLNEEGGMIDEVSGNDVPVGSTRKEVRDDVPAMLSEGEFVFPADVVRYLGLEKLMSLRNQAKAGLAHMEEIGQMGNADEVEEDLPFSMDDIIIAEGKDEPVEMAEGGYLPSFMTSRKGDTPIGAPSADDASFVPTLTYETYMNDKGQSTIIPHFGGKPIYAPPVGYTLVSGTGEAADTTTAPTTTDNIEATQPATGGGGGGNAAAAMLANRPQREAIDYTKLTDEELADALSKNRTTAGIATGLGFVAPPLGLLMKFATGMEKRNILKEYERRGLEAPEVSEGFLSNLFDNVKNLFGFGDKEEAAAPAPTRTTGTGGGATPTAPETSIRPVARPTTPASVDNISQNKADALRTMRRAEENALYTAMVNDVTGNVTGIVDQPPIPMQGTTTPTTTATTTERSTTSENASLKRLEAMRAMRKAEEEAKATAQPTVAAPVKEPSPAAKEVRVGGSKMLVYPSGEVAQKVGDEEHILTGKGWGGANEQRLMDYAYEKAGTNRFVRPTGTQMAKGGLAAPKKKK